MRNRSEIRTFRPRPLYIDVDPLVVAGGVSEPIDAILFYGKPGRYA
jgi:hypothetical protein